MHLHKCLGASAHPAARVEQQWCRPRHEVHHLVSGNAAHASEHSQCPQLYRAVKVSTVWSFNVTERGYTHCGMNDGLHWVLHKLLHTGQHKLVERHLADISAVHNNNTSCGMVLQQCVAWRTQQHKGQSTYADTPTICRRYAVFSCQSLTLRNVESNGKVKSSVMRGPKKTHSGVMPCVSHITD